MSPTGGENRPVQEPRKQLAVHARRARRAERLTWLLEEEAWPQIPDDVRAPVSRAEREAILGFGPDGCS